MLDIGISVGALLIVPVANSLAVAVGWRHTYHIVGGASMAFVALWMWLGAEEPGKCWFIGDDERHFLQLHAARPDAKKQKKQGGGALGMPASKLQHPALWAIFLPHIAFNYGAYFMTNWNPTYYKDVLQLSPSDMRVHLALPHVANLVAKSLNPILVTFVEKQGYSLLRSRQIFTVAGMFGSAAAMLPIPYFSDQSVWWSTLLFVVANCCFGLAPSGFKSNYLDVTVEYVGIVSGIGNTLGTVASYIGPLAVAYILSATGRWELVMVSIAVMNLLGAACFMRYAQVTPIEQDEGIGRRQKSVQRMM